VFASLKKWAKRWIANFRRQIRKWTEQERERKKKGERKNGVVTMHDTYQDGGGPHHPRGDVSGVLSSRQVTFLK
jgi:hypothetical protein